MENLFENIMKENFPNLAKEIDFQEVQEAHRTGWIWSKTEKMKAMLRETKENVQGTNSEAKETGTQINGVKHKEEKNIQPEKNEETRTRENEERLRNL